MTRLAQATALYYEPTAADVTSAESAERSAQTVWRGGEGEPDALTSASRARRTIPEVPELTGEGATQPESPSDDVVHPILPGATEPMVASTLRLYNRILRSQTADEEYRELMHTRNELVDKMFSTGLSRREELRLQMIRWKLEGIEDARLGPGVDRLEYLVGMQERIASEIQEVVDSVERGTSRARNRRRPSRK